MRLRQIGPASERDWGVHEYVDVYVYERSLADGFDVHVLAEPLFHDGLDDPRQRVGAPGAARTGARKAHEHPPVDDTHELDLSTVCLDEWPDYFVDELPGAVLHESTIHDATLETFETL